MLDLVEMIKSLLDYLGIKKVNVIGLSISSHIVSGLLLKYPEIFASIIGVSIKLREQ